MNEILSIITWILCGVLSYGMCFAYFQGEYPDSAERRRRRDMMFGIFLAFTGPIALTVISLCICKIENGKIKFPHGLKFYHEESDKLPSRDIMNMSLEEVLKIISTLDVNKFYIKHFSDSDEIRMYRDDISVVISLSKRKYFSLYLLGLYLFTSIKLEYKGVTIASHVSLDGRLRKFYDKLKEEKNLELEKQEKREYEEFERLKLELKSKLSEDKI